MLSARSSTMVKRQHQHLHAPTPHHHHHHQSLNCKGRWGITDDFATSFLHFSLFSTALWDLPNSRPVHCLMLSSHLFLCPPCLLPPFTVPCKEVLARPDERETWPRHCSLRLFTFAIAHLKRAAYVVRAQLNVRLAPCSARLVSACATRSLPSELTT